MKNYEATIKQGLIQLKGWLNEQKNSWKVWGVALLVVGLMAICWDLSESSAPSDRHQPEPVESAATFIPAGFVLVPIEVENYESLDSILGKFGVVDLYRPAEKPGARPLKVASRVKILRAPLNPSHFAVLAPENDSQALVTYPGAFTVVVQNPNQSGTAFEDPDEGKSTPDARRPVSKAKKHSRIIVETVDEVQTEVRDEI